MPGFRDWDVPLGSIGLGAMAIVGGAAYTIGEFTFYGFQFLPYWPLMGGWMIGTTILSGAWGTLGECLVWNGGVARRMPFWRKWRNVTGAIVAAGILAVLVIACWFAHPQYQCAFLSLPILGLFAFAGIVSLQDPIAHALRAFGRPAFALAALLALEAVMMFMIGEWMAIDGYRKGLAHFQTEHHAEWSIAALGGGTDFRVDYARQEIVLRTRTLAGSPVEIRRSLAGFVCK
jgi:hypothetical protein